MKQVLSKEELERVGRILSDPERQLAERFRALFTLKNIGGPEAIYWICQPLVADSSALLKHECAFCLGQMQDPVANDVLIMVLKDLDEHPMVRHEAGEALGAIGSLDSLEVLIEFCEDKTVEVAQTCQLAVRRIDIANSTTGRLNPSSVYMSVDPTPPADSSLSLFQLRDILLRQDSSLFDKYTAMFALRNAASPEAIRVLGEAMTQYKDDKNNALLKHELAYVLGQIQSPISVPFLKELLEHKEENEMVRHECAEALGSIASDDAAQLLLKYKDDDVRIVKESIEVALDMADYEKSDDQFQFMDSVLKHSV
ncbi:Deoxyhypusine hydroxylase [Halotydeus destructor]|nr:Deoxyhypusine hydroxylase [Halotydeus destructor]